MRMATRAGVLLALSVMLLPAVCSAQTTEGALDAKRKAGAQFVRDGKLQEALVMLAEVAESSDAGYRDHLALARVCDKLNRTKNAADAYRKVLSTTSDSTRNSEERTARAEAERRLKAIDPVSEKIRLARQRMLKEAEELLREADASRSDAAIEQAFRLYCSMVAAEPNSGVLAMVVPMKVGPGHSNSTGMPVVAGQVYRCRARGTWRVGPTPDTECNANGLEKRNEYGPIGMLVLSVDGRAPYLQPGTDSEVTIPRNGVLYIGPNVPDSSRVQGSGSLFVLIERKD